MRLRSFEFNLRELAGSMGDFGTLLPLAIGYITVCGLNPAGLLILMGLANVATGLVFRLPMPIEPMKVLAAMAIAGAWTPEKVYTAGLVMGLVWLLAGATGAMTVVARWTPNSVVRGIQLSLGVLLAVQGVKLIGPEWALGLAGVAIIVVLRENRYAPAALVLVAFGLILMAIKGQLSGVGPIGLRLPPLTMVRLSELWPALRDGGLAQIPLTATNAVIATSTLITRTFPDRRVPERQLSFSTGAMNVILPFFGGMPLCHGAGGLAAQVFYGARTGGANLLEGAIEIGLGLFLAGGIATLFAAFPSAILGAMMLLVGLQLVGFGRELKLDLSLIPAVATVLGSVFANMAVGFAAGLAVHYLLFRTPRGKADALRWRKRPQ